MRLTSLLLLGAATATAGAQQPTPPRDSAQRLGSVQITTSASGQGETRNVSALSKLQIQERAAGTSALKVLERLPGVNVQSADPWGAYEWANRITIRGFQTQQIGQTFDGLPLGDMSYGNFNGLGVGRAVDADNIAGASVAQGAGALGTASANNLGGVVQYASDAPRAQRAFTIRQTVGAANTLRTTGRYDSGIMLMGENGLSGFLSFTRQDNDKWKGGFLAASPVNRGIFDRSGFLRKGQTWLEQVNAKTVAFMGAHKFTGYYSFSNRSEADYVDFSNARWSKSGRDWDQFTDWTQAKQFATTSGQEDEAYWQSSLGARRDHLTYFLADFALGENARFSVQPYLHYNKGNGDWHAPTYGPSSWSPDPIFFRQSQYDIKRGGVNARFTASFSGNAFEAGLWNEGNTTNNRRVGWRLKNYQAGPDVDFNNEIRLFYDRTADIKTTVLYVQNANVLVDGRLKLTYGAKYLNVTADFRSNGNTDNAPTFGDPGRPDLSVTAKGDFLPQLGVVFNATPTEQLFANYQENVNQYPLSPSGGVYNLSPAGFDAFKANVKPERATSVDFGIRTKRADVEASLSGYVIDYRNRLVGVANCQLTATCASVYSNVGKVNSYGVEGLLNLKLSEQWSWATSASLNSSKIADDYKSGTTTIPAKDKNVVDAPSILWNTGVRFAQDGWTGNVDARYVDKRNF
jgi:iron complex outermembrane receptor protein